MLREVSRLEALLITSITQETVNGQCATSDRPVFHPVTGPGDMPVAQPTRSVSPSTSQKPAISIAVDVH